MLRYFYKKFGTTDLVPKLNLTGSRRRDFFISQIITEMVEKCNVPNQINIFLREQWTLNTRGSVVVTPPSFFLSGSLLRYAKKSIPTVRREPSADPTKHGTFVLCISGHFSVFEVLNFFVQQIIKNAPEWIFRYSTDPIPQIFLETLKRAFKIVLGNLRDSKTRNRIYLWYILQSCRGFHPLTRSNKKPFRLKEKILFKSEKKSRTKPLRGTLYPWLFFWFEKSSDQRNGFLFFRLHLLPCERFQKLFHDYGAVITQAPEPIFIIFWRVPEQISITENFVNRAILYHFTNGSIFVAC